MCGKLKKNVRLGYIFFSNLGPMDQIVWFIGYGIGFPCERSWVRCPTGSNQMLKQLSLARHYYHIISTWKRLLSVRIICQSDMVFGANGVISISL